MLINSSIFADKKAPDVSSGGRWYVFDFATAVGRAKELMLASESYQNQRYTVVVFLLPCKGRAVHFRAKNTTNNDQGTEDLRGQITRATLSLCVNFMC